MKSIFHTTLAILLLTSLSACEGNTDGIETPDDTQGYQLSIDKTEIEADGKDAVTFTLTAPDGTKLTDGAQLNYVYIEETTTGTQLEQKTKTFTAIKDGTYTFKATYKTHTSENTVSFTAKNRSKYEKYFRKVAAYKLTNVFCTYCPLMTTALSTVPDEWKQHMIVMSIHGPFDARDPFILGNNIPNNILARFVGSGAYPSCVFNLDYTMRGATDARPSFIANVIENQMRTYPATCGISIKTTYANEKITIEAGLTSTTGGKYDLGYALLADNKEFSGGIDNKNMYNHIVAGISGNYMSMLSTSTFTATANTEHKVTFEIPGLPIQANDLPNYRIVVFALRPNGNASIIDNIAECALNQSVDYLLN